MRRSIAVLLLTALAAVAFFATQLRAQVVLPDLPPGTQYQIMFVTKFGVMPFSANIADYNDFVTTQANQNSTLAALGLQWHAIASTASVEANVNAPSSGLVYNTGGIEIASADSGLYSGSLLHAVGVSYDQNGYDPLNHPGALGVWTGSDGFGNPYPNEYLGSTISSPGHINDPIYRMGQPDETGHQWLDGSAMDKVSAFPLSLYALSTPFTVVPEPATFTLFGSALLLLGGFRFLRR